MALPPPEWVRGVKYLWEETGDANCGRPKADSTPALCSQVESSDSIAFLRGNLRVLAACLFMARLSRSVSGVAHCLLIPCWRGRGTSDTRKRSALNISTAMRIKDSNGLFLTSSLDVFMRSSTVARSDQNDGYLFRPSLIAMPWRSQSVHYFVA